MIGVSSTIVRPLQSQRGVVLVTALIVLVVMTIIGLLSINTTTLQSKMTGNLRETNAAFQAAEAGLQAGLAYIENHFAPPMADSDANVYSGCTVGADTEFTCDCDSGCSCASEQGCAFLGCVIENWKCSGAATEGAVYSALAGAGELGQVEAQPRILIDERQVRTDMEVGAPVYYYYTVSAVGAGPAGKGRSILQTTIVKRTQ